MVALWNYDTENKDCFVCHKDLMIPVQVKDSTQMSSDVMIGPCKHGFHTVCIQDLIQTNKKCPQCSIEWLSCSNVGAAVYIYNSTN